MTSLDNFAFTYQPMVGEAYKLSAPVTVDRRGIFRITLNDSLLIDVIRGEIRTESEAFKDIYLERPGKDDTFQCNNLEKLKYAIEEAVKILCQPKTERSVVIIYNVSSEWTAWVNQETGKFWPSGASEGADPRPLANWTGQGRSTHLAERVKSFSFGVGASVCVKTTITRGKDKKSTYSWVDFEEGELGPWGKKLNQFCYMDPDRKEDIPYTEEAAKFFYSLIMATIDLGLRTMPLFNTKKSLKKAIQDYSSGQRLIPHLDTDKEHQ